MRTNNGYFELDPERVEALIQERGFTPKDFKDREFCPKALRKLKHGKRVQEKNVDRFLTALGYTSQDPEWSELKYSKSPASDPADTLIRGSWERVGTPSEWRTTGNGLQYRIQTLRHVDDEKELGRGKCYDLSQFDGDARERVAEQLQRHRKVLTRLERERAFPVFRESGYDGSDHYWTIDRHEEGITLREYMALDELEGGGLPFAETMHLMVQILEALRVLHGRDIIRRELNPDTILIRPDRQVMLTELELCKLSKEFPTVVPGRLPGSTWLAPELGDQKIDDTVDVYSWGKIFLYVATGEEPPEFISLKYKQQWDAKLIGYPDKIWPLLLKATSPGFRSRLSAVNAMGQLNRVIDEAA